MCASVVAQRITGEWDETPVGERNTCLAGAKAIHILTEWDWKKAKQGSGITSLDCEAVMAAGFDKALKRRMISLEAEARHQARAFSCFHVGAALLTKSGEIVTDCNVELHTTLSSICAERTAMVKAVSMGHAEFQAIAVVSNAEKPVSPCAFCRQYLVDFDPEILVIMASAGGGKVVEMTTAELLPMIFMGSGRE